MATVSDRAADIRSKILDLPLDASFSRRVELRKELIELIEQALLAERRLAMEEAAKIADGVIAEAGQQSDDDYWSPGGGRANVTGASEVVARLRAAVATPRGGE